MSSVITISQPPPVPGDRPPADNHTEMTFAPMDPDLDPTLCNSSDCQHSEALYISEDAASSPSDEGDVEKRRQESLDKLVDASNSTKKSLFVDSSNKQKDRISALGGKNSLASKRRNNQPAVPDAVIVLKEERAHIFHDFLRYAYPQYGSSVILENPF